ncbi:methyltransferase domain-containing protein [Eubacteriaceae bacterium ES2]|nr:methyltransferase domain-containing protein [Eubacteriaceae bacterium ES2]
MNSLINWELLHTILNNRQTKGPEVMADPGNFWDSQAPMYDQMAKMEKDFTRLQIDAMPTSPEDSVLDLCCGPGRITSMIAERVKTVTAIDASPKMLEYCQANCQNLGLKNVTTRLMNWDDVIPNQTIEKHDLVIASRSLAMPEIKRLNALANKAIAIVCWANAPHIPVILGQMFKGTSTATAPLPTVPDRRFGYNLMFNMIYDLGLDPNITILDDGFTKTFDSYDEAYSELRKLRPFTDEKLAIFKNNLAAMLSENQDGTVTFKQLTKSYVLWWRPQALKESAF